MVVVRQMTWEGTEICGPYGLSGIGEDVRVVVITSSVQETGLGGSPRSISPPGRSVVTRSEEGSRGEGCARVTQSLGRPLKPSLTEEEGIPRPPELVIVVGRPDTDGGRDLERRCRVGRQTTGRWIHTTGSVVGTLQKVPKGIVTGKKNEMDVFWVLGTFLQRRRRSSTSRLSGRSYVTSTSGRRTLKDPLWGFRKVVVVQVTFSVAQPTTVEPLGETGPSSVALHTNVAIVTTTLTMEVSEELTLS